MSTPAPEAPATEPVTPVAEVPAPAAPAEPTGSLADVPFVPPAAPVLAETEAQAIERMVKDLGERAFHAAWQSGAATAAAMWTASGVDVHSLTHLSGVVKTVIPILAAAGASALSAAKTVLKTYRGAKKNAA